MDKHDALDRIIITQREVIRFTRREQLCILMKPEDFEDHEFHWVKRWVRFIIEVSNTHVIKDSEDKDEEGDITVEFYARKNTINATTWEDINYLLAYGYTVDDDRLPAPKNKTNIIGDTEQNNIKRYVNGME